MPFKKGYTPWNKGKTGYTNSGSFTSQRMMGNTNGFRLGNTREKSDSWKGGFVKHKDYVLCLLPEGHKFSCMKNSQGYVLLHRLTMAEFLNRPLTEEEVVHHKGDKWDNRIEKLMLFNNNGEHLAYHRKLKKEMILV